MSRDRIYVSETDHERLRALVEQHQEGRDAAAAERLDAELDRAVRVPDGQVPADVVAMNSRVVYEDGATGRLREVTLVYPTAADLREGRLSVLAPVGAALLGLSTGQSISWTLPDGREVELRVRSVQPPPAAPAASAAV
ncbi:GreA/GreB family elongation factor [Anaeromyxobacter sp. K]|uniref:nucleoside diphosphate kinase regulator n=1 Tax=Anaeromyxobacter sp. (strain K) TaxID=447217 RepID=UPI00015F9E6E|nr:nucleoside diphosphate kinase regulator [Anaeromyxobacter sp. K]ACG71782.1 GreA/GreB family elongation factor [Anaeromyxobacter sp. K]